MQKYFAAFGVVVSILITSFGFGLAAEFGPNSENITNRYCPFSVGDRSISIGCPDTQYEGQVQNLDGVITEDVDGISCLKVYAVSEGRLITLWLAQDIEGNVWALKVLFHGSGETYSLGNGIISPFMPAVPKVGDRVGLTFPESDQYYCEIKETGVSVPETCWGMGPFSGCLKIQCGQPPLLSNETEYICPDVGSVKYNRGGWGTELKEIIKDTCPADVNEDGKIGLEEVIYILQKISGLRQ